MIDSLLCQIPIAVGFIVTDIAFIGSVAEYPSNAVQLPFRFAMGVFASKTNQLGADSFIPPAVRIQLENFLDNIGLFWIDNICTVDPIIPQDVSRAVEDPFLSADLLARTNTLRILIRKACDVRILR